MPNTSHGHDEQQFNKTSTHKLNINSINMCLHTREFRCMYCNTCLHSSMFATHRVICGNTHQPCVVLHHYHNKQAITCVAQPLVSDLKSIISVKQGLIGSCAIVQQLCIRAIAIVCKPICSCATSGNACKQQQTLVGTKGASCPDSIIRSKPQPTRVHRVHRFVCLCAHAWLKVVCFAR